MEVFLEKSHENFYKDVCRCTAEISLINFGKNIARNPGKPVREMPEGTPAGNSGRTPAEIMEQPLGKYRQQNFCSDLRKIVLIESSEKH